MAFSPPGITQQTTSEFQPRSSGYPASKAFNTGLLKVSDIHTLYYEESGNPDGIPALFVHGGPGSGANPSDRRFFNPRRYRLVLFDQRGCGKSTPHAALQDNTTWDSVADIERLRQHLDIHKWLIFGGSWGSTLALAYSQAHPEHVQALILRGIFLGRSADVQWFYQSGASALFPDAWEHFIKPIPLIERGNLVKAYYERLCSTDEAVQLEAAKAWSRWEGATTKLFPSTSRTEAFGSPKFATAFARIECHYFVNDCFFDDDTALLNNIDKIRHIPAVIVQGRYDACTPMQNAWALHRQWPEAAMRIITDAGHASGEPGITHELVRATDQWTADAKDNQ